MTGSRYVKAPQPTAEETPLYEAALKVLSSEWTVTQAAQAVGMSRLRFQTRLHRGLHGLMEALAEQPRGRRPIPEAEATLQRENARLQAENARLSRRVEASARMMGIASEWMHKGLSRAPKSHAAKATKGGNDDADEESPAGRLRCAQSMREGGVHAALAALAVGLSAATLRRWRRRAEGGQPLRRQRGPRQASCPPAEAQQRAASLLEQTHGCIGAAPLARAVGLSRRQAAATKGVHVTRQELARRAATTLVSVPVGVIRGFDAVMLGHKPVLVSADGAVPFRTSVVPAGNYDGAAVARAVAADFAHHGAPLVWRVDRARAHTTPEVLDVLSRYGVLLLHGPPHFPRFYGQLERQNREHRVWLDALEHDELSEAELATSCEMMRRVFNEKVPRRTLGWKTAAEVWCQRKVVAVNRQELADEVAERVRRLKKRVTRGAYAGLFERLAIEAALTNRGLLGQRKGGWC